MGGQPVVSVYIPMRLLLVGIICIFMTGCATLGISPRDGGSSQLRVDTTTTTFGTDDAGNETKTVVHESTIVNLEQPENPEEGGSLKVIKKPDGEIEVYTSTGSTFNIDADLANIGSLSKVTYAGIGLILAGVLIGVFTKGRMLKTSLIFGGAGIGLIVLAFLLPEFKMLFMLGLIAAAGLTVWYFIYSSKRFADTDEALDNTVATVNDHLSSKSLEEIEEFKELSRKRRSKTTKNVIRKKKDKLDGKQI